MPKGRKAPRDSGSTGIGALPEQEPAAGQKSRAANRRGARAPRVAQGPGGLGYVLALEEREKARIEWHAQDHPAPRPAKPRRARPGKR